MRRKNIKPDPDPGPESGWPADPDTGLRRCDKFHRCRIAGQPHIVLSGLRQSDADAACCSGIPRWHSSCIAVRHERHRPAPAFARYPDLAETQALAGTIALAPRRRGRWRAPVAGLDANELDLLLFGYFPAAAPLRPLLHIWREEAAAAPRDGIDEFDDLAALLLAHQTMPAPDSRWLAYAVATASMADNHLWQDLGLPSRAELNTLMQTRFAALKRKNSGDMKWKKFFYRELCEAAAVPICRSPNCEVCCDHSICFGPET